ncbi:hypothetical protein ACT8ZS_17925 [Paenibacillus sp. M.A.Huq-84]
MQHQQTLYQADPHLTQSLRSIRDRIHHICRHHVSQLVRIQTLDGQVYTGIIVQCEGGFLYLKVPRHDVHRAFIGPSSDEVILTLVLYELLVITLLYT